MDNRESEVAVEAFHYELGVTPRVALDFFYKALREETAGGRIRKDDLLYVASILAHYACTSCSSTVEGLPAPATPSGVLDQFYLRAGELMNDPSLLEVGGSQCLLFAGFFREQVRKRHNVKVLDTLGKSLFSRASALSRTREHRETLTRVSESFIPLALVCRNLNRTFLESAPDPRIIRIN